jgi:hypothetical protein
MTRAIAQLSDGVGGCSDRALEAIVRLMPSL